jgi:uncharacterized protein
MKEPQSHRPNLFRVLRRRSLRIVGLALCGLVIIWLSCSWLAVFFLTRRAKAPFSEPAPLVDWGSIESLRLSTADRQELGAWFVRGPERGPSVLLLHGNGDCRRNELPLAKFFVEHGCSVLLLTLRAHGDSTGEFNDIGYSARHDVEAAVSYLEKSRKGRPILVQGTSLGAAAALYAAKTLGTRVCGYVLEAPYADLRTAARNRTEMYLPFPLSRVAYAGLSLFGPLMLPEIDHMAPVEAINGIPTSVPVLLLAGDCDPMARPAEARALFARISNHGRLVWFEHAGHESFYAQNPLLYAEAVGRLIELVTPVISVKDQIGRHLSRQ